MNLVAPSVLACDFGILRSEVLAAQLRGADYLHVDVMDGHFVPNISFGEPVIRSMRNGTAIPFDIHMMVSHPMTYIPPLIAAGGDIVSFHIECEDDTQKTIDLIRSYGAKPAIAIRPNTPAEAVFPYLEQLFMVLVMTVEPGFGGQRFMPMMLPKIQTIHDEIVNRGLDVHVEVDGGIDKSTACQCVRSGADVLVAGSYFFRSASRNLAMDELKNAK